MERLTFDGNFCDIAQCREQPCPYNGSCTQREVWERLKAYEDTGLSPKGLEHAAEIENGLNLDGYSITRMVELMNADRDGRVVVLPCKVGDTVYYWDGVQIIDYAITSFSVFDDNEWSMYGVHREGGNGIAYGKHIWAPELEFSKTVFLTREEAEKALEAMQDG